MIPHHNNSNILYEKRNILLLTFVAVSIFLWSNGFNLRIFDLSDRFNFLNLAAIFIILFIALTSLIFRTQKQYLSNYYFWCIIGILAATTFPTLFNLVLTKGLSFRDLIAAELTFSGLFIFIILISFKTNHSFVTKINTTLIAITSINVLAIVLLSLVPNMADSIFVKTSERFERIRIGVATGLGPMVHYVFFYLLVMCIEGAQFLKRRIIPYFLSFIVFTWYIFAVEMGRRTIFAILAVTSYYLFIRMDGVKKLRIILLLPFIFAFFVVIPQSSIILDSIQSSFITATEEFQYGEGNVGIRVFGIEYYMNLFKESGYIGIGMYSNKLSSSDVFNLGREAFSYNPADHGIFAVLYQFGFPAIALTLIFLFHIFRDLKVIRFQGLPEHSPIAMAIHLYLVFSIIGLLAIFWKPVESLWVGIMLFLIWRMNEAVYEIQDDKYYE